MYLFIFKEIKKEKELVGQFLIVSARKTVSLEFFSESPANKQRRSQKSGHARQKTINSVFETRAEESRRGPEEPKNPVAFVS